MKKKRIIFVAGAVALLFAVTSTKPVDSQNYPKITVKTKRVNKYKDKIEDYESDNLTLKLRLILLRIRLRKLRKSWPKSRVVRPARLRPRKKLLLLSQSKLIWHP